MTSRLQKDAAMRDLSVFVAAYAVSLFAQWVFFFDPFHWEYEIPILQRTLIACTSFVWIVLGALAVRRCKWKAVWLLPSALIMGWTVLGLVYSVIRCPGAPCSF
jgi:hypothetical protein